MKLRTTLMLTLISSALTLGVATAAEHGGKMRGEKHETDCADMGMMQGGRMDSVARAEKHLSELKAKLKLTKDQEPAWQTFSGQVKDQAKSMAAMMHKEKEGMRDMHKSAPDKMAMMASMMTDRAKNMSTMADNVKTFYATLTPEQKVAFDKVHMNHTKGMKH
ncbi:MAG: Spy/CpxP family protein refolding chaperone [Sulfuricella sp.]